MFNPVFIPVSELKNRHVYLLESRNLHVGVWDETKLGFIGIRNKFNREFLDIEYHWDTGGMSGTANALKNVDMVVEETIPLVLHVGSFTQSDRQVVSGKEDEKYVYRYLDTNDLVSDTDIVTLRENEDLFELLKPLHDEQVAFKNSLWEDD